MSDEEGRTRKIAVGLVSVAFLALFGAGVAIALALVGLL